MKASALMLLMAIALSGCMIMVPGHLYPIQGPLASQTPLPIFPMSLNGILNSGTLKVTLQGSEACKGSWRQVRQDDPSANMRAAQWDAVYGQGYFIANVLGSPVFARSSPACAQGSTVDVEFYNPNPGDVLGVVGIAQDNKGNLYKVTL